MSDTSGLKQVTEYILKELSNKVGKQLYPQRIRIGQSSIYREFTGVSNDKDTVVLICHNSGLTKSGNIPSAKLDILFGKCYFMEKVSAKQKYIYFTNEDFYKMFSAKSNGIINDIKLRLFNELPDEYKEILDEVLRNASNEMS